jgi:two-component sensor histidine kinase
MVYLKAFNQQDPNVGATLNDINQRITAMALAQQLLYKSSDLSRINMKDYLDLLSKTALAANPGIRDRIAFTQECVDLDLLIDEAIPCGLLINELLTNSCKHAFPAGRSGNISLSFTAFADKRLLLHYCDDGIGLPDEFNIHTATSFGLCLIKSLSEYQLAGTLNITRDKGLGFSVSFPINIHKERVFHENPDS